MSSTYETLRTDDACERCGLPRDLSEVQSNGRQYELCPSCATAIRARRHR